MTKTQSQTLNRIADHTADLLDLAVTSDYEQCDLCPVRTAELFNRTDEAGDDVAVCEHCADTLGFGLADCD